MHRPVPASFRRRVVRTLALVATLSALAGPARAELVILTSGDVMKVLSYQAGPESATLDLAGGGTLVLPLQQIDRVLEDEVVFVAEPEPELETPGGISLRFSEDAPIPEGAYGGLTWWAAKKHSLNPQVVAAVARAESAWNPRAVSRKGARGLMQLMPATASRFGLRRADVFDVEKNLDAGSRYLAWLAERFDGDLERVLAAYNAGEGAVERYGGVPPYRETREYVRRIYGYLGLDPATSTVVAGLQSPQVRSSR